MRLIDADKLKDYIRWFDHHETVDITVSRVLSAIDEQSTVEAKPVVHGEWLERDWFPFNLYCSVCGKEGGPFDFCPDCGADMRGEKYE